MLQRFRAGKADEELMKLVQHGDQRALSELYGRYSRKLVRYFHRMLWRDENKAQDFLHDLFIKVIEKKGQFDPGKNFSTWIYSAAFNMCKNEYRKQAIRIAAHGEIGKGMSRSVESTIIDANEFREAIDKVLDQAEESDRNLFILRHELEMPLHQIATILDCPEGTVKSRLFNLKKKLAMNLRAFNPAVN
jgi:RNA polymerase sigma-70 factor (ECF subfamily)